MVVALNRDSFIARFKGKPPVCTYAERAAVLSACHYVDAVVENSGDEDSKKTILEVGPNFILIGEDWANRDYCKQMGFDRDWLEQHCIQLIYVPRQLKISSNRFERQNLWTVGSCAHARSAGFTYSSGCSTRWAIQKERVVVVATLPNPLTPRDLGDLAGHVVLFESKEPAISKWWNAGTGLHPRPRSTPIRSAWPSPATMSATTVPWNALAVFLRQNNLTMVGPDHHSNLPSRIFRIADRRHCQARVPGGCWMIAGESGLRVDESFRWWYSDDDFEMQARQVSGSGVVAGTGLVAEADTPMSELKQQWAREDRPKFAAKWGQEPW